ncbi:MAG: flagellin [Burkholderiales bacterium]|nr:flagellin [Burkholderiales bacterium]
MAMSINTNVSSLTAQRSSSKVQDQLSTSMARLSSGLRINSAKDDAAGLAISERFTTQIRGLNQASRNANDAISLSQTAESALGNIGDNLQRIRELAVQSANATNSDSDRAALQSESSQLMSEVQRVSGQANFNGINLLDGSFTSKAFQVGANAGETISVASITDARTTSLGSNTLAAAGSIMGTATAAGTDNSAGNGIAAETTLTLSNTAGTTAPIAWSAGDDARAIASSINTAGAAYGIKATASNASRLSTLSAAGTVSFSLTGNSTAGAQTITANVTSTTDLTALANAINGATSKTGISASFDGTNKGALILTSSDGSDISLQDFTNSGATGTGTLDVQTYDAKTATAGTAQSLTDGGNDSTIVTGNVSLSSSKGALSYANATNTDVLAAASGAGTFTSLATVDISTAAGATAALDVIDSALSQINSGRADLGAVQNRFSSTVSNLQSTSENLTASRSRIQDADFAQETANLSRAQVLQQAATAMLSQANQLPQQVLQLLR